VSRKKNATPVVFFMFYRQELPFVFAFDFAFRLQTPFVLLNGGSGGIAPSLNVFGGVWGGS